MSLHPCSVPGCGREIRVELLMCPAHWARVPRPVQIRVYAAYSRWCRGYDIAGEALREVQAEATAAVVGGQFKATAVRRCRVCGCTDADCRQCIAATGRPCSWVSGEPALCSRCAAKGGAA